MNRTPYSKRRLVAFVMAGAVGSALLACLAAAGSASIAAVPASSEPPTITGTAQQGKTLTASSGSWTSSTPVTFAFQWLRCDASGASCGSISGATEQTYSLTGADAGSTIRVQVTAHNADGSASATSDPTAVVASADAPVDTAPPVISGTARQGQTLSASIGSWTGSQPISYGYVWLRCNSSGGDCTSIPGATTQTYTLGGADFGHALRVQVTATNAAGASAVVSAPSAVVVAGSAPANTAKPTISGKLVLGQVLNLSDGSWSGGQPISFAYAWERCDTNGNNCQNVPGATGRRYLLHADDIGRRLRGSVTAKNSFGSSSAFSNPTDVVPGAPIVTSVPTISGTTQQGSTLTASNGNWSSPSPISFSYQWSRCDTSGNNCQSVPGATGRRYLLHADDIGRRLIVQVKATNAAGANFANSNPTSVVGPPPPVNPPTPKPPLTLAISSISLPDRLVVDRIQFSPSRIRSPAEPLIARFHVADTAQGVSVAGALVYAVGVPFNRLSAPPEAMTGGDGWAQITFRVLPTFSLRPGNLVVVFVRARKPGENVLAGVSTRRLVSVGVGR